MYQLFDGYKEMMQPVNYLTKSLCNSSLLNNDKIKNRKSVRHLRASAEMIERLTRRYEKPDFGLNSTMIDGQEVPIKEEIVLSKTFCNLVNFKRNNSKNDQAILMVAPMAGHYAALTRDTIKQFLPDHDVYITDWKNVRDIPIEEGEFGFDDFVEYLVEFLRFMGPGNTLMSACQPCPGALVAAAVLAMEDDPAQPESLILMAGPVDPRINQAKFLKTATDKISPKLLEKLTIDTVPAQYKGRNRRVYAGFRQLSFFMSMNIPLHLKKHFEFYKNLLKGDESSAEVHRIFYDNYSAMVDGDAKFYMDTMERVFQEHHLPKGIMQYKGKTIDTGAIKKTALMTVEGEKDQFCPPGQTEAAHGICPNIPSEMREQYLQAGVGHYGVFSGSKFRDIIAPKIKAFIKKNATPANNSKETAEKAKIEAAAAVKKAAAPKAAIKKATAPKATIKKAAAPKAEVKEEATAKTASVLKTAVKEEVTVKTVPAAETAKKDSTSKA